MPTHRYNTRVKQTPQQVLKQTFGYTHFRDQQEAIITAAMQGHDALVLMPTGGGKSLCYQIPALLRPGIGLVISPLIALMHDQVTALQQLGVKAAYLNSSLEPYEQQQVYQDLQQGHIDMLYIAPERLIQAATLNMLSKLTVSLIAIDEAHCVSQWGHDFRQDYLSLSILRTTFPDVPRMALTATADQRTRIEIVDRLELNDTQHFISGFDRPNIRYTVQSKTDPKRQLLQFLTAHRNQAGIVYCMSRKKVEKTAEWLCQHGFKALPYHAGLTNEVRAKHQNRFLREDSIIIVATIAFGMGIDKPDVRFVAHLDLPKSMEAYYQETGRAGRDGEAAEAWMIYGLQDVVRLRQMLDESNANEEHKRLERQKLDALLGWCELTKCRRHALLAYFGEERPENAPGCNNCDICLQPPATWEATVDAQKLLSCIYRTGQRFGAAYIIDVLRGKKSDKITQNTHQQLSTFNIGQHLPEMQWRSIIRQLMVQGFIYANVERYGALALSEKSRSLLRGEITLHLRKENITKLTANTTNRSNKRQLSVSDNDRQLWDALRECRKQLADKQGVPPYVIFHDATLMEMMEYRPKTANELLGLNGIGQTKLERYGNAFLNVINTTPA